jgi:DNA-binding PadR family transcriptional regulator
MSRPIWTFGGTFPFAAMYLGRHSRFFDAGEIRLAILSLLSEGPKHGYQLMKEMSERSGGIYKASAGSVYPTLQQLEDDKLIKGPLAAGRRTYTLTKAGRKELERDPEAVRRIWERAEAYEDWSQCMAPEGMLVYGPLSELFKTGLQAAGRIGSERDGPDRIRKILERARKELEEL